MTGEGALRTVRLGGDRSAGAVLRGFGTDRGVVCLRGSWAGGGAIIASEPVETATDPYDALRRQPTPIGTSPTEHCVGGGWFGLLGYPTDRGVPTWLGCYDHVLRFDAGEQTWWFEALWTPERAVELERRQRLVTERVHGPTPPRKAYRAGEFAGTAQAQHLEAVERCITHIRAGDIFQVNVALRLEAEFDGSALDLFADVSDELRPAYAAYVDTGESALAGFSPELFLRRRGRSVTTSPIKGTRPRIGIDDEHESEILRGSAKDAAENVMIVDLIRNDLGRVCAPGTVRVPALLDIQPHPGVWHLVSTVTGELADDVDDAELLRATFPPGSVTGAPKTRAMQLIDQHEAAPRDAFSGSVGFSSPVYGAEFNVTIRSFEIADSRIALCVGGGITVDSVPIEEWRECLTKARPLLRAAGFRLADPPRALIVQAPPDPAAGLLETVLVRDGRAIGLADHLARLDRSCRELYGTPPPAEVAARVVRMAVGHERARLRIVATPVGAGLDVAVTVSELTVPTGVDRLVTMTRPDGVWRHKYADRAWLAAAEERAGAGMLPLFLDECGQVLETTRGNVFLVEADGLVTPPLTDAILPGVTRRQVLDIAFDMGIAVAIEPITVDRIYAASGLFTTSAISELTHITALDGRPLPLADKVEYVIADALAGYR